MPQQIVGGPGGNIAKVNADGSLDVGSCSATVGLGAGLQNVDFPNLIIDGNPGRLSISIQNLSVVPVYLHFGGTTVNTTTQFHMMLKACTAANDGTGGVFYGERFTGQIYAVAASGTGNKVVLLELERLR